MTLAQRSLTLTAALILLLTAGCGDQNDGFTEVVSYPLDDIQEVMSRYALSLDTSTSSDGKGSLRVTLLAPRTAEDSLRAAKPFTIRLVETGDIDVEDAMLIYRASIRSEDLRGMAYLEMWCVFADGSEYFSRGLNSPWTGTVQWSTVETPFFLKAGQNPVNVKLNLVIEGRGTVWIDHLRLLKAPLPPTLGG